jgi:hypothetical protein
MYGGAKGLVMWCYLAGVVGVEALEQLLHVAAHVPSHRRCSHYVKILLYTR